MLSTTLHGWLLMSTSLYGWLLADHWLLPEYSTIWMTTWRPLAPEYSTIWMTTWRNPVITMGIGSPIYRFLPLKWISLPTGITICYQKIHYKLFNPCLWLVLLTLNPTFQKSLVFPKLANNQKPVTQTTMTTKQWTWISRASVWGATQSKKEGKWLLPPGGSYRGHSLLLLSARLFLFAGHCYLFFIQCKQFVAFYGCIRGRPIFPTDFKILTTLGFGWVGGLGHRCC